MTQTQWIPLPTLSVCKTTIHVIELCILFKIFIESTLSSPYLTVSSSGTIRTVGIVDYEVTGQALFLYVRVTDKGGLFLIKAFEFVVNNLPEKPSSTTIICYCDENKMFSKFLLLFNDLTINLIYFLNYSCFKMLWSNHMCIQLSKHLFSLLFINYQNDHS